jgi:hypothetical protein
MLLVITWPNYTVRIVSRRFVRAYLFLFCGCVRCTKHFWLLSRFFLSPLFMGPIMFLVLPVDIPHLFTVPVQQESLVSLTALSISLSVLEPPFLVVLVVSCPLLLHALDFRTPVLFSYTDPPVYAPATITFFFSGFFLKQNQFSYS